jgi:hypothetical protein
MSVSGWLVLAVIGHLVVATFHGRAHAGAHVPLSPAANLFVFGVILAGPLAGLALTRASVRAGTWIVGITMAASFAFGVVNHFLRMSPDHVMQVAPGWRPLFAATALLLALTEGLGTWFAVQLVRERRMLA